MILGALVLAAALAVPDVSQFSPVLLPLHDGNVSTPGLAWRVDEVVLNAGDDAVRFYPYYPPLHPLFAPAEIGTLRAQRKVSAIDMDEPVPCRGTCARPHPGAILWIDRNATETIAAYDRVYEAARDQENHGAIVPAVGESSFRHSSATLAELPVSENFRTMLRLYNLAGEAEMTIRIIAAGAVVAEHRLTLPAAYGAHPEHGINRWPGYAQLPLESLLPQGITGPVTVTLVAQTQPATFWAFAPITSNSTQRVTIVTP